MSQCNVSHSFVYVIKAKYPFIIVINLFLQKC